MSVIESIGNDLQNPPNRKLVGVVDEKAFEKALGRARRRGILMVTHARICLWAFLGASLPIFSAFASVDGVDQAMALLAVKNHVASPHVFLPNEDTAQKAYNAQLDAIRYLAKAMGSDSIPILIPYIDYCTSVYDVERLMDSHVMGSGRSEVQQTKSVWPAFGAILDMPQSANILYSYAFDEKNPLNYRLTILQVLAYKDQTMFNRCCEQLKQRSNSDKKFVKYILYIRSTPFCGMINLKFIDTEYMTN